MGWGRGGGGGGGGGEQLSLTTVEKRRDLAAKRSSDRTMTRSTGSTGTTDARWSKLSAPSARKELLLQRGEMSVSLSHRNLLF